MSATIPSCCNAYACLFACANFERNRSCKANPHRAKFDSDNCGRCCCFFSSHQQVCFSSSKLSSIIIIQEILYRQHSKNKIMCVLVFNSDRQHCSATLVENSPYWKTDLGQVRSQTCVGFSTKCKYFITFFLGGETLF